MVTCYRHELGRCRSCRRWPQQPGVDELLRKMIGPNVRADSLFLQYDIGLTLRFFAAMIQWVKRGCDWHRKWKNRRGAERDREAEWLRQELERLQKMPTTADSDRATRLRKRIRKYSGEWLTFLDHPGVAPTNNLAEQALRAVVILRKLTFGSRSKAGAKRLGTMMTVIETAKRQGKNVLTFLGTLLTMDTNRARRAMYSRQ